MIQKLVSEILTVEKNLERKRILIDIRRTLSEHWSLLMSIKRQLLKDIILCTSEIIKN